MLEVRPCDTPTISGCKLVQGEGNPFPDPTVYRSAIGALHYLTYTRPNISFIVNKLSQFLIAPSQAHWQAWKRVLRHLKITIHKGL